jgi:hypothetical protein
MSTAGARDLRQTLARLGPTGITAAALIGAASLATAVMLPGLVAAIFAPTPGVAVPPDAAQDQAARLAEYRARIDGRTMFFTPAAPPPPPPPTVDVVKNEGPPPAPPPPSSYGGPAPIGMINDTVWLADGQHLKVGDEAEGDIQVVRLEAPWAAVLKWKGVEFTVKVFERDQVVVKAPGAAMVEGTPPEPKPTPPPEPPAGTATVPPPADTAPPPSDPDQPPPEPSAAPETQP